LARRRFLRHGELGDPVDERSAFVGVALRDGIAHEFLVLIAGHDHRASVEERLTFGHRTPQDALREVRFAFIGIERVAQHGMDAVGTDERSTLHFQRRTVAALETRSHRIALLLERLERGVGHDALAAQPLDRGLIEQHLQIAAVNRVLRHCVTGRDAARLTPDQLAEFVVVLELAGLDCGCGQFRRKAELMNDPRRMRQEIDADAERLQLRHLFEHTRLDAARMQTQCSSQAADAAAHDQDR
jgi:hypothetical protein